MKVTFCSVAAVDDPSYWSGTPYFMAMHLARVLPDFKAIGPLQLPSPLFRQKHTLYTKLLRQNYIWELEPVLHKCLSAEVDRLVQTNGMPDLIFSPGCLPYPNVFLNSSLPVVFWSDATFDGLLEVHPGYRNLCPENIWCGHQLQQRMLDRASLAIFSSTWAAESAINRYGVAPQKVAVIPFGANLHFVIEDEVQLKSVIDNRDNQECRLLFVGTQWNEKGGDFAAAVLNAVQAAGIRCKLTVIGAQIPDAVKAGNSAIEVRPALVKDAGPSEQSFADVFASSHFLLHPSRGDCFGITMCEASAWAVPVLAHDTGGARSVISEAVNGYLFSPNTDARQYAERIIALFTDYHNYQNLCRTTWQEYQRRLNWPSSASAAAKLLQEIG